jgi:acetyl-CoA C-acetyltransferase
MTSQKNLPIIIGVGQVVSHWDGRNQAPSPVSLATEAINRAKKDVGVKKLTDNIDHMVVIRAFTDSLRRPFDPFGKATNFPAAIAAKASIKAKKITYSAAGGEQPQALVNELCRSIYNSEIRTALLVGSEAKAALKTALKHKISLDWSSDEQTEIHDRGPQTDFISSYEIANGIGLPPQTYAILEEALRGRLGLSKSEYQHYIAKICTGLSKTAQLNPFAQFPTLMEAPFLSTASAQNYPICDPYLKWNIAQDSVNQGASLILTCVDHAQSLGIPEEKWIYLHGYASVNDKIVSKRPDLSKSKALEIALRSAIEKSGIGAKDLAYHDIYSCFPIVVHLAAEVLGLDATSDQMSVTGGLPFFGGAGNNYSTHAIASLVEKLRVDREAYGLILANGGFISKVSAGVYAARSPSNWTDNGVKNTSVHLQQKIADQPQPPLLAENCEAVIEAYTVRHSKYGPDHAYLFARNAKGRIMASLRPDHRASIKALHLFENPIGQKITIEHQAGKNYLSNTQLLGHSMDDQFLHRQFEYIQLNRDGHVLEITLNRPEAYNALFSAAHFELAEIFDEFERDQELWVAIITGAGDKAFCSGNDLKITASGGDMSIPSSGFAGLCSRTDREKPVIAAVNGVAMGGGLEIILACDVAIADPKATFALPEVKVGLFAAAGGVQRLTRQIGEKAAMELILTGRHVASDEAVQLGLINSVSSSGDVLQAARQLAQTIAGNSPTSIRASKRVLNAVDAQGDWDKALALSKTEIGGLLKTKDAREGVTAFAQKRKPKWVNG